ncbi:hypothetical protein Zm00014a_041433 [Zea mays]|uniref:Uncharacterized protein n=1 Tax=Zea mays TaxID=4577 RepID=A0A3L6DH90_MAIZE|nr:hypothetical protein Zm00014a_041433 [Zea mays]
MYLRLAPSASSHFSENTSDLLDLSPHQCVPSLDPAAPPLLSPHPQIHRCRSATSSHRSTRMTNIRLGLQGGRCFNPDTVHDHASYAFNSYPPQPAATSVLISFSGLYMVSMALLYCTLYHTATMSFAIMAMSRNVEASLLIEEPPPPEVGEGVDGDEGDVVLVSDEGYDVALHLHGVPSGFVLQDTPNACKVETTATLVDHVCIVQAQSEFAYHIKFYPDLQQSLLFR